MKAAIFEKYGKPEVLHIKDVEQPQLEEDQVLIKMSATAVTSADYRIRKADPFIARLVFGLMKPKNKILGNTVSGTVEAIGKSVNQFKPGDEVYGSTGMKFGAYAEYVSIKEGGVLAPKPQNLSFEAAAAIPFGSYTALHFLKKVKVEKGKKLLIYGASGAVGTAAVQLAKYFGAEVTGVCSTSNLELVKSLGADKVLDYTTGEYASHSDQYDIIFETVGKTAIKNHKNKLKQNGVLALGAASMMSTFLGYWISMVGDYKVVSGVIKVKSDDLIFLKELIENDHFKPVIDRSYPLEEISAAHQYVEKGHKKGNVVINIQ